MGGSYPQACRTAMNWLPGVFGSVMIRPGKAVRMGARRRSADRRTTPTRRLAGARTTPPPGGGGSGPLECLRLPDPGLDRFEFGGARAHEELEHHRLRAGDDGAGVAHQLQRNAVVLGVARTDGI